MEQYGQFTRNLLMLTVALSRSYYLDEFAANIGRAPSLGPLAQCCRWMPPRVGSGDRFLFRCLLVGASLGRNNPTISQPGLPARRGLLVLLPQRTEPAFVHGCVFQLPGF